MGMMEPVDRTWVCDDDTLSVAVSGSCLTSISRDHLFVNDADQRKRALGFVTMFTQNPEKYEKLYGDKCSICNSSVPRRTFLHHLGGHLGFSVDSDDQVSVCDDTVDGDDGSITTGKSDTIETIDNVSAMFADAQENIAGPVPTFNENALGSLVKQQSFVQYVSSLIRTKPRVYFQKYGSMCAVCNSTAMQSLSALFVHVTSENCGNTPELDMESAAINDEQSVDIKKDEFDDATFLVPTGEPPRNRRLMSKLAHVRTRFEQPKLDKYVFKKDRPHPLYLTDSKLMQLAVQVLRQIKSDPPKFMYNYARPNPNIGHREYNCAVCDRRYDSVVQIRAHLEAHIGFDTLTCRFCGKYFHWISSLNKHERRYHLENRLFPCGYCSYAARSRYSLGEHLKLVHDINQLVLKLYSASSRTYYNPGQALLSQWFDEQIEQDCASVLNGIIDQVELDATCYVDYLFGMEFERDILIPTQANVGELVHSERKTSSQSQLHQCMFIHARNDIIRNRGATYPDKHPLFVQNQELRLEIEKLLLLYLFKNRNVIEKLTIVLYQCRHCLSFIRREDGIVPHLEAHLGFDSLTCNICNIHVMSLVDFIRHLSSMHNLIHPIDESNTHECFYCLTDFQSDSSLNFTSHVSNHSPNEAVIRGDSDATNDVVSGVSTTAGEFPRAGPTVKPLEAIHVRMEPVYDYIDVDRSSVAGTSTVTVERRDQSSPTYLDLDEYRRAVEDWVPVGASKPDRSRPPPGSIASVVDDVVIRTVKHQFFVRDPILRRNVYNALAQYKSDPDTFRAMNRLMGSSYNGRYTCPICNRWLNGKSEIQPHLEAHLGLKSLTCKVCGHHYVSIGSLDRHIRIHHGTKKLLTCQLCDQRFDYPEILVRHLDNNCRDSDDGVSLPDQNFVLQDMPDLASSVVLSTIGHVNDHGDESPVKALSISELPTSGYEIRPSSTLAADDPFIEQIPVHTNVDANLWDNDVNFDISVANSLLGLGLDAGSMISPYDQVEASTSNQIPTADAEFDGHSTHSGTIGTDVDTLSMSGFDDESVVSAFSSRNSAFNFPSTSLSASAVSLGPTRPAQRKKGGRRATLRCKLTHPYYIDDEKQRDKAITAKRLCISDPASFKKLNKSTVYLNFYVCPVCDKLLKGANEIEPHLDAHLGSKSLTCDQCGVHLHSFKYLQIHKSTLHNIDTKDNNLFRCFHCLELIRMESNFLQHLRKHDTTPRPVMNGPHVLYLKDKVQRRRAKQALELYISDEKRFRAIHAPPRVIASKNKYAKSYVQCKLCYRILQSAVEIRPHFEAHLGNSNALTCEFCGQYSLTVKLLKVHHKNAHWSEKLKIDNANAEEMKEKAEIELLSFTTDFESFRERYRNGIGTHYTCEACGIDFPKITNIRPHLEKHIGRDNLVDSASNSERFNETFNQTLNDIILYAEDIIVSEHDTSNMGDDDSDCSDQL